MINRRDFLLTSASSGLGLSLSGKAILAGDVYYYQPAEWIDRPLNIMIYPSAGDRYSDWALRRLRIEIAEIAKIISFIEPVMLLAPEKDVKQAQKMVGEKVDVVPFDVYSHWTRDVLPSLCLTADKKLQAINWNFNGWGRHDGYDKDFTLATRFCDYFRINYEDAAINLEASAYDVDGLGNLLITESCVFDPNRPHDRPWGQVAFDFGRYTGADNVLWLHGSSNDGLSCGGAELLARFLLPGVIATDVVDDKNAPDYRDRIENQSRLQRAYDRSGGQFQIFNLPHPAIHALDNKINYYAASYLGFYHCRQHLLVPQFGDAESDKLALEILANFLPKHQIIPVQIRALAATGANIHRTIIPSWVDVRDQRPTELESLFYND